MRTESKKLLLCPPGSSGDSRSRAGDGGLPVPEKGEQVCTQGRQLGRTFCSCWGYRARNCELRFQKFVFLAVLCLQHTGANRLLEESMVSLLKSTSYSVCVSTHRLSSLTILKTWCLILRKTDQVTEPMVRRGSMALANYLTASHVIIQE